MSAVAQKTPEQAQENKKGSVSPIDRLPVKATFNAPPPNSPYHTQRAADARANARTYLPAATILKAAQALVAAGLRRRHADIEDTADHNALTLAAALTYAGHGLNVVDAHALFDTGKPTNSGHAGIKVPRGAKWQERATTDAAEIEMFWTGDGEYPENARGEVYPYARVSAPRNVSIAFTPGCGLFALDIDGGKGQEALAQLEAEHGALPETVTSLSGSQSGFHMIFRASEAILNTASAIAPGVDIRGEGGQIIAPPSVHPTFGFYEWEEGHAPGEVAIAEAPEWLVKAALAASKKSNGGRRLRPEGHAPSREYEPVEPTGDSGGFESILETIGDHAGRFDRPIYRAACAWFGAHGWDADASTLLDQLEAAIIAAPCDNTRNVDRYATPEYLEGRVEQARDYIETAEAQEAAFCAAGTVEEEGAAEGDTAASAAVQQDDVQPDNAEFEPAANWLPGRKYIAKGDTICRKGEEGDTPLPICALFDVVGRSSNADGTEGAGVIISFQNKNGVRVEKTIARADIMADGLAVVRMLADADMIIAGRGSKANDRLLDLLHDITPRRRVPTVNVPGWTRDEHGEIAGFMHPTGEYDRVSGPPFRLLEGSRVEVVKAKGTLEGWKAGAVAALTYADSNFYWPLGIAAGFAGPLLGILDWDPCGFSFSGLTTKGKTLAQVLGASVWTTPKAGKGLLFSGSSTKNAFEDQGVRGTDTFYALDEIGAMSDRSALGDVLMALSAGRTKSRKSGRGLGMEKGENFRPFTILTSEHGLRNEVKATGQTYRGGLSARYPDIDVSEGIDVPDDKRAEVEVVRQNYGHAGAAYIRYIQGSGIAADAGALEREVIAIASKLARGRGSAMARAARPFAVAQRGGEIAADAGLLGDVTTAKKAIETAVQRAWDTFTQSDEAGAASAGEAVLDTVKSFLQRQWDRTIISAGAVSSTGESVGEADGMQARGTPIGWYDADYIYLDWKQLEDPGKLGLDIGKRNELVKALHKAVERKSAREAPQAKLPAHVAQAADGDGRSVKNLKLKRAELGL